MTTLDPKTAKKLHNPKTYQIPFRKKKIGEIMFYTEFPTPTLSTKTDRYQWWKIAETLNRVITPDMWKIMSTKERERHTLDIHCGMFPTWNSDHINTKRYTPPNTTEVRRHVIDVVKKCYQEIDCNNVTISIVPSIRLTSVEAVGGTTLPRHRNINLYIDGNRGWKRSLADTLSHELMHVAYTYPLKGRHTLIDQMIREGLAEHFNEHITKRPDKAITRHQYNTVATALAKHKYWLNRPLTDAAFDRVESDTDIAHSIGYTIVGLFLKTMPSLDWYSITAASPQDIFKVGRWALDKKLAT